jgi:p-cumate 2,3-dioxygenase subunit alpha
MRGRRATVEIAELVLDQPERGRFRVHRSALTSAELFDVETRRVFDQCWLYVGHESEVPNRGDYRRRTVAGRPLFLVRGGDDQVRVFLNTCTHRGAMVCRRDEGSAEVFQCFYHAWTFNNRGELIGTPDAEGYPPGWDRAELGLRSPPRVESYRGMVFVSFNPAVAALPDYLAGARELMDLTFDSAEVLGGWTILSGTAQYELRANWKLLVENSIDSYHFPTVHQTYLSYQTRRRAGLGPTQMQLGAVEGVFSRGVALGNGHGAMLTMLPGRPIASPSAVWTPEAQDEVRRVRGLLDTRFGPERAQAMAETSRHVLIFPNLLFQDSNTGFRFRQIWPVAPDRLEVLQWELVPREERADVRGYRLESSLIFLGPGGFGSPDDGEALESCQQGYRAPEVEWNDLSRGLHRDGRAEDEEQLRSFWRQWHALMQGRAAPVRPVTPAGVAGSAR